MILSNKASSLQSTKITTRSYPRTVDDNNINTNSELPYGSLGYLIQTHCLEYEVLETKSLIDLIKVSFKFTDQKLYKNIRSLLKYWLTTIGISISTTKAVLKYHQYGVKLFPLDETTNCCGAIKWDFDKKIIQLELSGHGCSYVSSYSDKFKGLYALLIEFNGSITEVDIAVDDYSGKFNLRYVQKNYSAGSYDPKRGSRPSKNNKHKYQGSIYIGSSGSAKSVLIYDKGAQIKSPRNSTYIKSWTRHEVTYRKKNNHFIPNDVLFNHDAYFVGAYPKIHKRILKGVEPRCIKREKVLKHINSVCRSAAYVKYQNGRAIHTLNELLDNNPESTIKLLSRSEHSKKHALPHYIDETAFAECLGIDEVDKLLLITELHDGHYSDIQSRKK